MTSVTERFTNNENALNEYIVQLLSYTHGKGLHTIDPKLITMGLNLYEANKSDINVRVRIFKEYTEPYWNDIESRDKSFLSTFLINTLEKIGDELGDNVLFKPLKDKSFPQLIELAGVLFISEPSVIDDESINTLWILLNNMRKLCIKYYE